MTQSNSVNVSQVFAVFDTASNQKQGQTVLETVLMLNAIIPNNSSGDANSVAFADKFANYGNSLVSFV